MKSFTKPIGLYTTFFLFLSILPVHLFAQNVAKRITASNGDSIPFLEYKPSTHDAPGNTRKYPLIVFLHGGGQRNDNPSLAPGAPVWAIEGFGPARQVAIGNKMAFTWNGQVDTFIVLSPMCRATYRTGGLAGTTVTIWPAAYVTSILNYAIANLRVDTCRIYLTGLSFGGGGTFSFTAINAQNPKRLAAAAPICAPPNHFNGWGTTPNGPQYVGEADLPVWGFHAEDDATCAVTGTTEPINDINNRIPAPDVEALMTIWPTGGHNIWGRVYDIDVYPYGYDGIINIYEWFLGQNKCLAVNTLPVANVGSDITISTISGTATLDGSASTDTDGSIVRYVWKKIAGPAGGTITTPLGSSSSTTVTGLTTTGVYKYELSVVDNRGAIATDILTVTVINAGALTISSSGKITTGDVTELKSATQFTMEAQFKYNATVSTWTTIMYKYQTFTDRIMFHVGPNNNSVYVMVGNGSNSYGYTAADAVSPGTWYHVAAVFDGTQTGNANRLKLYINGVQQTLSFNGTIPASTSATNAANFVAGGETSCCNVGAIDEVRVWNTALSSGTIAAWKDKLLGSCHPDIGNLVVYWPLDNYTNAAVATAALGTAYTGTVVNSTYVSSTQATAPNDCGKALTISSSGKITTGDVTQLKSATKFTMEAQFKYNATVSTWTTIMYKYQTFTDRIMFHVGPNNNSIYVMVGNGSNSYGYTAANAVSPGTWYHVAAVFDGTLSGNANRLKLYIDGVQQTLSFSGTIPANTSATIAANFVAGGESSCCNVGAIDEIRVWNTALSNATISAWKDKLLGSCHPDIGNLVVYWPLENNANAAVATAELGTTYTGTITNSTYVSSSQATATSDCDVSGKAVTMFPSGTITTGDVTQLNNVSAFTLETQFKYNATVGGWTTLMRKGNSLSNRIMLHIGPSNNSIYVMVGNGNNSYGYTAANAVSPGTWYHVAAVYDGTQTGDASRLKLYIDGVQQSLSFSATAIPATTGSNSSAPFIAGGEPQCCYLNGIIDEVRVWNTALSAGTIDDWKDKLLGSCHPDIANLVVYWPLDNNTDPATATAELGTAYTGAIANGSYVSSEQAVDPSGCSFARVARSPSAREVEEVEPFNGKLYPNPTGGLVQIELYAPVSKSVTVNVIDMTGKYLYRNRRALITGNNRITVNIASLASGTYIIEVGDGKGNLEKYKVLKR